MCIQGTHWGLCYILQGIQPENFDELSIKAHKMEINLERQKPFVTNPRKIVDKSQSKNRGMTSINFEESMMASIAPVKASSKKKKSDSKVQSFTRRWGEKEKSSKICKKKGVHLVILMFQEYLMISYKRNLLSYHGQDALKTLNKSII